jgi:transposase
MGKQAIGKTKGGWNTKIHMICASDKDPVIFTLSPGQSGDAPEGRALLKILGKTKKQKYLLMDRAYEGNETRKLAKSLNFISIVPPKSNRKKPWIFDRTLYKKRNEVERIFRRLDRFRRIFTRYDKLDLMFVSFIHLAFIFDSLFRVNRL